MRKVRALPVLLDSSVVEIVRWELLGSDDVDLHVEKVGCMPDLHIESVGGGRGVCKESVNESTKANVYDEKTLAWLSLHDQQ